MITSSALYLGIPVSSQDFFTGTKAKQTEKKLTLKPIWKPYLKYEAAACEEVRVVGLEGIELHSLQRNNKEPRQDFILGYCLRKEWESTRSSPVLISEMNIAIARLHTNLEKVGLHERASGLYLVFRVTPGFTR